jgi:hypothetical protein
MDFSKENPEPTMSMNDASEAAVQYTSIKIMKWHENGNEKGHGRGQSHTELTHLLQIMDFFHSFNPAIFEPIQ